MTLEKIGAMYTRFACFNLMVVEPFTSRNCQRYVLCLLHSYGVSNNPNHGSFFELIIFCARIPGFMSIGLFFYYAAFLADLHL